MQDSSEPQVKSKKLRELLSKQSNSRSITPSRSDLTQSIIQEPNSKNDIGNADEKPREPQEKILNNKNDQKLEIQVDDIRNPVKKDSSSSRSIKDIRNLVERIGSPISHHENHYLEDNQSKSALDSFLQNEMLTSPRSISEKIPNESKKNRPTTENLGGTQKHIDFNKENPEPEHKPAKSNSKNVLVLKENPEIEIPVEQGSFQLPLSKKTPKNNNATNTNEATTPRLRGYSPRKSANFPANLEKGFNELPTEICKFHSSNSIVYICLKDKCGDLLCPLCLYDHQKNKHIGEYEDVNNYHEKIRLKLLDTKSKLIESIEKAATMQTTLQKKENFDLKICEDLDRIEESIIKNIKNYFETLRQEYKNDLFFEYKKQCEDLSKLHERINVTIKNLETELLYLNDENNTSVNCHYLSDLVKKNYLENTSEMQKKLYGIDQHIGIHLKPQRGDSVPKCFSLEVDQNLKSKLMLLLNEGIKLTKIKSVQPNMKKRDTNEDILNYYKDLQKSKDHVEVARSRQLDIIEEVDSPNDKFRARTHSPTRDIVSGSRVLLQTKKDNAQNNLFDIYKMVNTQQQNSDEKDVDLYAMRYLLEYMSQYYNTTKIKIFDHEFFSKLTGITGPIDFFGIDPATIKIENVSEFLNVTSTKHKTIFTSHERIFFIAQDKNLNWILSEIRTNPKMVIVYDFLGKLSRGKSTENIFGILFEIIRSEYRGKLNQNPDHYSWEKKVSNTPSLVVKNSQDTGLLVIKIISNAYQTKDFTNTRVSLNEINMIRKKIDKIFDTKNQGKFVAL